MSLGQNKLTALLLLCAGLALFYWFQWRPAQIRQECAKITNEWWSGKLKGKNLTSEYSNNVNSTREDLYAMCLNSRGIKQ